MSKSKKFVPDWYHEKAPERSYRSILKWGDPEAFKAPNSKLYELMKETFHMTDDDFKVKQEMGLEEVDYDIPCRLSDDQIAALEAIVGKANVSTDNYDRLSVAYGKTMVDLMRLRKHIVENVPDAVVYPKNREDIIALVRLAGMLCCFTDQSADDLLEPFLIRFPFYAYCDRALPRFHVLADLS